MSNDGNPRVTLELESGTDPIRGTLDRADGSRIHFWGWLELMEELRRVATEHPEQGHPRATSQEGPQPCAG